MGVWFNSWGDVKLVITLIKARDFLYLGGEKSCSIKTQLLSSIKKTFTSIDFFFWSLCVFLKVAH